MSFPHLVLARLYEHLEPIDRGNRYEDPLQEALAASALGQVTGGGTQMGADGGIAYADIEIELANLDGAVRTVADALEAAGAPQGSELIRADDSSVLRKFGRHQCLGVFLDGTSLPEDVYADLDFDAVVGEIGAAAGNDSFHGFFQGETETGLFFFGPDAGAMFTAAEPVLRRLPIAQNARVVVCHGHRTLTPREVRMPRL